MSDGQTILVTGGTGTFGRAFIRACLEETTRCGVNDVRTRWRRVIAFSRDEVKQAQLLQEFPDARYPNLRLFLGDVRSRHRLQQAMRGVDVVVHAAALKRVDAGAYSPGEIIHTNITGTMNVVDEAIAAGVKRVVVLSSDKATAPTNIYGMSKGAAEFYAVQANAYASPGETRIAAVRYGNILGSRGSVVHVWRDQLRRGETLTLTQPHMTRFVMTIEQAVELVQFAIRHTKGGEVFVPVLPRAYMLDLMCAVRESEPPSLLEAPEPWYRVTGLRPGGEKLAEALLNEEEPGRTRQVGEVFVVRPTHHDWTTGEAWGAQGEPVEDGMVYRSDSPWVRKLGVDELRALIAGTAACQPVGA